MSESFFYKLGRGSLREAKEALRKLLEDLGDVGVYLDETSLDGLVVSINELLIMSNIDYLKGEKDKPASVSIDFFVAYIKSRNKLIVSDREVEEYKEEIL